MADSVDMVEKFAVQRNDQRKVGNLWAINSLGAPALLLSKLASGGSIAD